MTVIYYADAQGSDVRVVEFHPTTLIIVTLVMLPSDCVWLVPGTWLED